MLTDEQLKEIDARCSAMKKALPKHSHAIIADMESLLAHIEHQRRALENVQGVVYSFGTQEQQAELDAALNATKEATSRKNQHQHKCPKWIWDNHTTASSEVARMHGCAASDCPKWRWACYTEACAEVIRDYGCTYECLNKHNPHRYGRCGG